MVTPSRFYSPASQLVSYSNDIIKPTNEEPINSPSKRVLKSKTSLLVLQGTGDGRQLHTAAVQIFLEAGFLHHINKFFLLQTGKSSKNNSICKITPLPSRESVAMNF